MKHGTDSRDRKIPGEFLTGPGEICIVRPRTDPVLKNRPHQPRVRIALVQIITVNAADAAEVAFGCNTKGFLDPAHRCPRQQMRIFAQRDNPGAAHEVTNVGEPVDTSKSE